MDALIVVDMQEASFRGGGYHDQVGVVARVERLATHVRRAGGVVVFVQHDGREAEGLAPQTPGWQILGSLSRGETDIHVRKTTNDAFYGTPLDRRLRELGVTRVILCGWATDFCVDSTLRAAVSHGYRVAAASDAHTVADRRHLTGAQVVAYHNWLWSELLTPGEPVAVLSTDTLLAGG